jgi:uncharacterized membrane protein
MIKKIALALTLLLVAAQFIRPARNQAAGGGPNDIGAKYPVPAGVQGVLKRACYDCHSNNTHYPWYAEVQPVRWFLDSHVNDGKRHLNFSEFGSYTAKRAAKKADEIIDEVEQHQMPLKSYTWMHPEARLTAEEIKLLSAWAEALRDQIDPP